MSLSPERLQSIGAQAAKDVIGNVETVAVTSGFSEDGLPAYFFELNLSQDRDRARAALLRTRLRHKIRDLLLAEEDTKYPYIRILD
ncbi:hypothetical protein [Beijerinckia sp. L45]|uniref:hypothetical protein n=1 Tax=Beijerinckia sp. L45 TaxID=1641855 RepID=UPI00131C4E7A|nr:hypothetical protein [Beijerinckia sp. L45]